VVPVKGLFLLTLLFLFLPAFPAAGEPAAGKDRQFLFREHFSGLDDWQEFHFPAIASHSTYTIERAEGATRLKAGSNGSASAIVHKTIFNVYEYPRARWRWMIKNVYAGGDARTKEGDDYPIRIYVMFEYEPARARTWERLTYAMAKALYGSYPPHSSLSYVWASKDEGVRIVNSPYTDRAKMVLLRSGPSQAGAWQDEEVDILDDYRKAFGNEPPERARIAVMNDSDNTGESSLSWLAWLEVFRPAEPR
jgi:hypothetical protein